MKILAPYLHPVILQAVDVSYDVKEAQEEQEEEEKYKEETKDANDTKKKKSKIGHWALGIGHRGVKIESCETRRRMIVDGSQEINQNEIKRFF